MKDILVHVDDTPQGASRLAASLRIAETHHAHLTCFYAIDVWFPFYAGYGPTAYASYLGLQPAWESLIAAMHSRADRAHQDFCRRTRNNTVDVEWASAEGETALLLEQRARYADLCILGQQDTGDPLCAWKWETVERDLFGAGRPVLLLPYSTECGHIGRRVLVGWNGSKEATRKP